MAKVLIVYGSTTGNTESVAESIGRALESASHEVTLLDASKASPAGLCDGYDCVLFGCSTWGDDSVEFQDDFLSLFEAFGSIGVSGKKAAAFGCGDSSYTHFCGAVDSINERLEELGAEVVAGGLKIDGDPSSAKGDIDAWSSEVIAAL